MKFTKPSLSIEAQVDLLLSRGLIADRAELARVLSEISYYRLSGYLFPYRGDDGKAFSEGTQFTTVFDHYLFDRQLRVLVMDAIERVEVSIKARLVNALTQKYGVFAHTARANFPDMPADVHRRLMDRIHQNSDRSKEAFIRHYISKYTSETEIPLWMALEVMDFGAMLTIYRHSEQYDKRDIAQAYGLTGRVLESWLVSLNIVRNICAHHGRLWNKIFAVPPLIPAQKHRPEFHSPQAIRNDRVFAILSILRYMLQCIAPQSAWHTRVTNLWITKHPSIPMHSMGIPSYWKEYTLWQ